jgi:hypothetical protein
MPWKILADAVMGLHLLVIAFFTVSTALLALGVFKRRRNWRLFYCGVVVLASGLGIASWTEVLKSCSLTDLEYMVRRLYDPSESWMRSRSLLGTIIFDGTGVKVPEFVFTIGLVIGIAVMVGSLLFHKATQTNSTQ